MEQIGPIIQFVTKHRFWFICGLATAICLGAWALANSTLKNQRIIGQQAIEQQISELERIQKTGATLTSTVATSAPSEPTEDATVVAHPNATTEAGMRTEIQQAMVAMVNAWRIRRSAQESILRWPEQVLGSQQFVSQFSRFDPPEMYANIPDTQFGTLLLLYKNRIPRRMPEICDIIGTKWEYKDAAATENRSGDEGERGDSGNPIRASSNTDIDRRTYTVVWNNDNQKLWHEKLTRFRGIDGNDKEWPTPYQVLALQQDLWLLEAMFNIIKDVNGDATARDFATIKTIYYVVFGREARIDQQTKLTEPDERYARRGGSDAEGVSGPDPDRDPSGGGAFINREDDSLGGAPTTPFDPKLTELKELGPFHGRYVNALFQPIPVKSVYDVLNSEELPDENLELVVAKRVPVRIAVRMDERRIPDFIAACRNSPFAFEIELVRINCDVSGKGIEAYGGSATGGQGDRGPTLVAGGGSGAGGGSTTEGGENPAASGGGLDPANLPVEIRIDYDVNVEFYGVVKIYNPVNEGRILKLLNANDPTAVTQSPGQNPSGTAAKGT